MNILLILLGCMTYKSAIETACAAPSVAPQCLELPAEFQMVCLGQSMVDSVRNPKATNFLKDVGSQPNEDKAGLLREESASLGFSSCEMADFMDESDTQTDTSTIETDQSQHPTTTVEEVVEPAVKPADGTELPDTVTE